MFLALVYYKKCVNDPIAGSNVADNTNVPDFLSSEEIEVLQFTRCPAGDVDVDGEWGAWSDCSVACGDGTRTHECNAPAKANGGDDCVGAASESCNLGACTGGACVRREGEV